MESVNNKKKEFGWDHLMRRALARFDLNDISRQFIEKAIELDDPEREAILKVVRLTFSPPHTEELFSHCLSLYERLCKTGRNNEAITVALCDTCTKALFLEYYGHLPKGKQSKAIADGITAAENALELAEHLHDLSLIARISRLLGQGYHAFNRLPESISAMKKSREIYIMLSKQYPALYKPHLAKTFDLFANIYLDWGDLRAAEKNFQKSCELYQELTCDEPEEFNIDVAIGFHNLAVLYRKKHKFNQAKFFADRAYKLHCKINRKSSDFNSGSLFIGTCNLMGLILRDLGNEISAKKYFEEALGAYKKLPEHKKRLCADNIKISRENKRCLKRDILQLNKIKDMLCQEERYVFLVGAGISVSQPSNIFSGEEFLKTLVRYIATTEVAERELLTLCDAERYHRKVKADYLRFEELIQIIREHVDPNLDILKCLANCPNYNHNHYMLACLLAKGHIILTTNFDNLIEKACDIIGISYQVLVYEEEYLKYNEMLQRGELPKTPCIFKLHGSLSRNGVDTRDSIMATLDAVCRGGDSLQLEPNKIHVLTKMLQEHDLIVMGYSGRDDFDIIPALRLIKSKKRLIWVQHSEAQEHPRVYSWQTLRKAEVDCHGFFLRSREELLFKVGVEKLRRKGSIHLIVADTFRLLSLPPKESGCSGKEWALVMIFMMLFITPVCMVA